MLFTLRAEAAGRADAAVHLLSKFIHRQQLEGELGGQVELERLWDSAGHGASGHHVEGLHSKGHACANQGTLCGMASTLCVTCCSL